MKKVKIKVNLKDFYDGFLETTRSGDNGLFPDLLITGEVVEDDLEYKLKIGDVVFVKPYIDTTSYEWNKNRRILGNRWGKVVDTNKTSPKRESEGVMYFVEKGLIGGWEKEENLELINQCLPYQKL